MRGKLERISLVGSQDEWLWYRIHQGFADMKARIYQHPGGNAAICCAVLQLCETGDGEASGRCQCCS